MPNTLYAGYTPSIDEYAGRIGRPPQPMDMAAYGVSAPQGMPPAPAAMPAQPGMMPAAPQAPARPKLRQIVEQHEASKGSKLSPEELQIVVDRFRDTIVIPSTWASRKGITKGEVEAQTTAFQSQADQFMEQYLQEAGVPVEQAKNISAGRTMRGIAELLGTSFAEGTAGLGAGLLDLADYGVRGARGIAELATADATETGPGGLTLQDIFNRGFGDETILGRTAGRARSAVDDFKEELYSPETKAARDALYGIINEDKGAEEVLRQLISSPSSAVDVTGTTIGALLGPGAALRSPKVASALATLPKGAQAVASTTAVGAPMVGSSVAQFEQTMRAIPIPELLKNEDNAATYKALQDLGLEGAQLDKQFQDIIVNKGLPAVAAGATISNVILPLINPLRLESIVAGQATQAGNRLRRVATTAGAEAAEEGVAAVADVAGGNIGANTVTGANTPVLQGAESQAALGAALGAVVGGGAAIPGGTTRRNPLRTPPPAAPAATTPPVPGQPPAPGAPAAQPQPVAATVVPPGAGVSPDVLALTTTELTTTASKDARTKKAVAAIDDTPAFIEAVTRYTQNKAGPRWAEMTAEQRIDAVEAVSKEFAKGKKRPDLNTAIKTLRTPAATPAVNAGPTQSVPVGPQGTGTTAATPVVPQPENIVGGVPAAAVNEMPPGLQEVVDSIPDTAPTPSNSNPKLPQTLAGGKPRYQGYIPSFESDVDKALFIVSQTKPSKRDADYRKWLVANGITEEQIPGRAAAVRDAIGQAIAISGEVDGDIVVPAVNPMPSPAPKVNKLKKSSEFISLLERQGYTKEEAKEVANLPPAEQPARLLAIDKAKKATEPKKAPAPVQEVAGASANEVTQPIASQPEISLESPSPTVNEPQSIVNEPQSIEDEIVGVVGDSLVPAQIDTVAVALELAREGDPAELTTAISELVAEGDITRSQASGLRALGRPVSATRTGNRAADANELNDLGREVQQEESVPSSDAATYDTNALFDEETQDSLDDALAQDQDNAYRLLANLAGQTNISAVERQLAVLLMPLMRRLNVRLGPPPIDPELEATQLAAYNPQTNTMWFRVARPDAILHEALHAVTSTLLKGAPGANAAVKQLAKDFEVILSRVQAYVDANPSKISPRLKASLKNALANPRELLAYGLTDADVKAFLTTVPMRGEGGFLSNAWRAIKDSIAKAVGAKGDTRTALDAVLENTQNLIDIAENSPEVVEQARTAITQAIARRKGRQGEVDPMLVNTEQVNSPAFKRWFGKSKIVNKDGSPKILYHGTSNTPDFRAFATGYTDLGIHLGSEEQANDPLFLKKGLTSDQKKKNDRLGDNARIMPVYAKIENLLRTSDEYGNGPEAIINELNGLEILTEEQADELTAGIETMDRMDLYDAIGQAIQNAGYDGIVYDNISEGGGDSYIVFNPNQIKSAIGNSGAFNELDDNVDSSTLPNPLNQPAAPTAKQLDNSVSSFQRMWEGLVQKVYAFERVSQEISKAGGTVEGVNAPDVAAVLLDGDKANAAKIDEQEVTNPVANWISENWAQYSTDPTTFLNDLNVWFQNTHVMSERIPTQYILNVPLNDGRVVDREEILGRMEEGEITPQDARSEIETLVNQYASQTLEQYAASSAISFPALQKELTRLEGLGFTKESMAELNGLMDAARLRTRDRLQKAGYFTDADPWVDFYDWDWYVPLKGQAYNEATQDLDYDGEDGRMALAILNKQLNTMEGRRDFAERPFDMLFADLRRAADQQATNKFAERIYNFTVDNEALLDANIKVYEGSPKRGYTDVDGDFTAMLPKARHGFIYNDGDTHYVVEFPKKSQMARGLESMTSEVTPSKLGGLRGKAFETIGKGTNFLSKLYTTFDPIWQTSVAFARDTNYIPITLGVTEFDTPMEASKFAVDYGKNLFSNIAQSYTAGPLLTGNFEAFRQSAKDNPGSFLDWLNRYREAGGATDYVSGFNTDQVEDIFKKAIKDSEGVYNIRRLTYDKYSDLTSNYASILENLGRVAGFQALVEGGMSEAEAAAKMKNILNYQQSGKYGRLINSLLAFYRVGATGADAMRRAFVKADGSVDVAKMRAWSPLFAGLGFLSYVVSRGLMGDDEDGVSRMSKMRPSTLTQKMLMPFGDRVAGYSMGLGLPQVVLSPGILAAATMFGDITPEEAAEEMYDTITRNAPVRPAGRKEGSGPAGFVTSALQALMPTVAVPLRDIHYNVDAFGRPITQEAFASKDKFESEQARASTPQEWTDFARFMRENTSIDMFPENYAYLARNYGGQPIATLMRLTVEQGAKESAGMEISAVRTASRVAVNDEEFYMSEQLYDTLEKLRPAVRRLNALENAGSQAEAERLRRSNPTLRRQEEALKQLDKARRKYNEQINAIRENRLLTSEGRQMRRKLEDSKLRQAVEKAKKAL